MGPFSQAYWTTIFSNLLTGSFILFIGEPFSQAIWRTLFSCLLTKSFLFTISRPFSPVYGTLFAHHSPFPDPFHPVTGPFSLTIITTIDRPFSPSYGAFFAYHYYNHRQTLFTHLRDTSLTIQPFPDSHPVTGPFSLNIIPTIARPFSELIWFRCAFFSHALFSFSIINQP